jgi:hypothetical protein
MTYCSSLSYEQHNYYSPGNSYDSHGRLPQDEYRHMCRAQERERLETHFTHQNKLRTNTYAPYRSAYRDAGLSHSSRHQISEVQSATRAALGPSFDFTEATYSSSRARDDSYQRSRGWTDYSPRRDAPIPKQYRDEFDRWWHEDTEEHDADQYLADHVKEAPWRQHVPLEHNRLNVEPVRARPRTTAVCTPAPKSAPRRVDSGYYSGHSGESECSGPAVRPPLPVSKFSWESDVKPRRRGLRERFLHGE